MLGGRRPWGAASGDRREAPRPLHGAAEARRGAGQDRALTGPLRPHARRAVGIRMALPATERLVRHCGDHTATLESAQRPIPSDKSRLFMWHVVYPRRGTGTPLADRPIAQRRFNALCSCTTRPWRRTSTLRRFTTASVRGETGRDSRPASFHLSSPPVSFARSL